MNNIGVIRERVGTKVMAVLKADAYGNGIDEVARAIASHVDYYAVAYYGEGVSLRRVLGLAPILILIYSREDVVLAAKEHMCMSISSMRELITAEILLENTDYILDVHFAVNTGMNRYGFEDVEEFHHAIAYLSHAKHVRLVGIYSHLYDEDTGHNATQIARFDGFLSGTYSIPSIDIVRHLCATGGCQSAIPHYDMVRLGLGMYVGDGMSLLDSFALYSRIQSIRYVKSGEFIGYSCNYRAKCDIMIGVVYGGYADGLDRRLTGLDVLVEGVSARIIGAICMDVFFVDITGISKAHVGSLVTIIGGANTIRRVATHIGYTPYELITGLHGRVKRSYYHARGCEDRST